MKHGLPFLEAFTTSLKKQTAIGSTGQLYRNSKMSNLNFYGRDVKGIFNRYFFEPIDDAIFAPFVGQIIKVIKLLTSATNAAKHILL